MSTRLGASWIVEDIWQTWQNAEPRVRRWVETRRQLSILFHREDFLVMEY